MSSITRNLSVVLVPHPTRYVLLPSNRLQMIWIDAVWYSAKMIYFFALGDRPLEVFIRDAVRFERSSTTLTACANVSVARGVM